MPDGKGPSGSEYKAWAEFAGRHRGHPHLAHDPLYSLPEGLIDSIVGLAPGVFSEQEVAFERDLAKATGGGLFFRRRAVPCLLLPRSVDGPPDALDRRVRDARADLLKDRGISRLQLEEFDRGEAELHDRVDLRAAAFAGWLVSNRGFRTERDQLIERVGSYVEETGRFPSLPRSYLGEPSGVKDRREGAFHLFYRRWNLSSFLTWDLPLPLRPEVGVTTLDTFTLSGAGIALFLPWYVAEDGRFSPDEMAAHLRSIHRPAHLAGWLETPQAAARPSATSAAAITSSSTAIGGWSWSVATTTGSLAGS